MKEFDSASLCRGGYERPARRCATLEDDLDLLPSLQAGALGWLAQPRDSGGETEKRLEVIRLGDFLRETSRWPISQMTRSIAPLKS